METNTKIKGVKTTVEGGVKTTEVVDNTLITTVTVDPGGC